MATGNMLLGMDDYMNYAANQGRSQFDAGLDAAKRQAARTGLNTNSGAYQAMLNNAQYNRSALANASANNAAFNWLNAAQDQYNKDRSYDLQQQRIDNENSQFYSKLGWDQKQWGEDLDYRKYQAKSSEKILRDYLGLDNQNQNQNYGSFTNWNKGNSNPVWNNLSSYYQKFGWIPRGIYSVNP